jgi:hypothetical protein
MASGEVVVPSPSNRRKIHEKEENTINMISCMCYQNLLEQVFKEFSKLYQVWGTVT